MLYQALLFLFWIGGLNSLNTNQLDQSNPSFCIEKGELNCFTGYFGSWINSTSNTRFASFQGIRYAEPPIGMKRFKSPEPYIAHGIIDVSKESTVVCPQLDLPGLTGQEDCLFLNIYKPDIEDSELLLPIMVWIHGGGLGSGSNNFADFGPQYFMENNVIVVTINYRLGPLGFLTMGNEEVPGNAGLKDQTLALKWIKTNANNFGGDPDSISLFGESAGALSVALHYISPLSQNLFHRIILQSGTALSSAWGLITPEHALEYASMFSKALGCEDDESKLECLQQTEVGDIIAQFDLMDGGVVWYPFPDSRFSSDPFLPMVPEQMMSNGQFNKDIEVIIGSNADEGILFFFDKILDPSLWEEYRNDFDINGPRVLFNIANKSDITGTDIEKAQKILEFYVGSKDNIDEEHQQLSLIHI